VIERQRYEVADSLQEILVIVGERVRFAGRQPHAPFTRDP
jgi:hypothetical protein